MRTLLRRTQLGWFICAAASLILTGLGLITGSLILCCMSFVAAMACAFFIGDRP